MSEEPDSPSSSVSGRRLVYLAAERTLLSWVRVAIGLVMLGFAVDRFDLLLAERSPAGGVGVSWSSWLGLALIAMGIATSIVSAIHYGHFLGRYRQGDARPGPGIPLALGLAVLLGVVGVVMAIYLYQGSARGQAGRPLPGIAAPATVATPHPSRQPGGVK